MDGLGTLLGGAIFQVWRIFDEDGNPVSSPSFSVTDNQAPDLDPDDGEFLVEVLPLGTCCVQETAAPAGYLLDPNQHCGPIDFDLVLTVTDQSALNGVDGSTVAFTFVGGGEPGKGGDRATIVIKDKDGNTVLSVIDQVIRGNLQAHEDQPHR